LDLDGGHALADAISRRGPTNRVSLYTFSLSTINFPRKFTQSDTLQNAIHSTF
jgi:hypothetical protein